MDVVFHAIRSELDCLEECGDRILRRVLVCAAVREDLCHKKSLLSFDIGKEMNAPCLLYLIPSVLLSGKVEFPAQMLAFFPTPFYHNRCVLITGGSAKNRSFKSPIMKGGSYNGCFFLRCLPAPLRRLTETGAALWRILRDAGRVCGCAGGSASVGGALH